jgi:hypothetical protein
MLTTPAQEQARHGTPTVIEKMNQEAYQVVPAGPPAQSLQSSINPASRHLLPNPAHMSHPPLSPTSTRASNLSSSSRMVDPPLPITRPSIDSCTLTLPKVGEASGRTCTARQASRQVH